jgi:hypothetical protein
MKREKFVLSLLLNPTKLNFPPQFTRNYPQNNLSFSKLFNRMSRRDVCPLLPAAGFIRLRIIAPVRVRASVPVETCFSMRPFTLRRRWLAFQQVSAAGSTLLAYIFKAVLKSRLARSASCSRPRPAFSCRSGHDQRSLPVAKSASKALRLFSSRRSPSGPLDPSGS